LRIHAGEVTAEDAEEVLQKITTLHRRALEATATATNQERIHSLRLFAANLEKAFYGSEPDFFQPTCFVSWMMRLVS
jgi:hypothetical protein